jgi:photosystem II oxygen-evolving enhancer protein 3
VDLFDDRKVRSTGFDLIYEARDLSLTQAERDGLVQARSSVDETKKRVKASEQRIDSSLEPFVSKAYWTEAREELRRQVGTLRFDLNTLASAKGGKAEKKQGLALSKGFIAAVEDLDLSLRKKDKAAALTKLETAKAKLDEALAYLL